MESHNITPALRPRIAYTMGPEVAPGVRSIKSAHLSFDDPQEATVTVRDKILDAGRKIAEEIPGELLQADSPVSVQKVSQSLGSKVAALGLPLVGVLISLLSDLPPNHRTAVILVTLVLGGLIWDRSKSRQYALQVELVKAGASQISNSVVIEPPATKAE